MRYLLIVGIFFIGCVSMAFAEAPEIEWEKAFGGLYADYAYDVVEIEGVGYVAAGSFAPGVYEHDIYVIKTDLNGNIIWDSTFGGAENDYARAILATDDGGVIVTGPEQSFPPEGTDIYTLRLNQNGGVVWSNIYGYESRAEVPQGMCRLVDGNYMIVAYGLGNEEWDIWKINPDGGVLNEVTVSCSRSLSDIIATSDGGAMVIGDGLFLLKLDSNGDSLWTKVHASSSGRSVVQLDDGGYAALGEKSYYLKGDDFRLIRLDQDGEIVWDKNYGNELDEFSYELKKTPDGGFVMVGYMYPSGGVEDRQVWVVRTDSNGDTLWTKAFGGEMGEIGYSIEPTADSGYIIAGETYSYGAGSLDVYLVKLGPDPEIVADIVEHDYINPSDFCLKQNYPNPFNSSTAIEFDLPCRSEVDIRIYNLLGQEILGLINEEFPAGMHRVSWDGHTSTGQQASTGVYFYRIEAGEQAKTRKMILLK